MNSVPMELTMENTASSKMNFSEILFGSIMAAASIFGVWYTIAIVIHLAR